MIHDSEELKRIKLDFFFQLLDGKLIKSREWKEFDALYDSFMEVHGTHELAQKELHGICRQFRTKRVFDILKKHAYVR